jgi:hypothetical protein
MKNTLTIPGSALDISDKGGADSAGQLLPCLRQAGGDLSLISVYSLKTHKIYIDHRLYM